MNDKISKKYWARLDKAFSEYIKILLGGKDEEKSKQKKRK